MMFDAWNFNEYERKSGQHELNIQMNLYCILALNCVNKILTIDVDLILNIMVMFSR